MHKINKIHEEIGLHGLGTVVRKLRNLGIKPSGSNEGREITSEEYARLLNSFYKGLNKKSDEEKRGRIENLLKKAGVDLIVPEKKPRKVIREKSSLKNNSDLKKAIEKSEMAIAKSDTVFEKTAKIAVEVSEIISEINSLKSNLEDSQKKESESTSERFQFIEKRFEQKIGKIESFLEERSNFSLLSMEKQIDLGISQRELLKEQLAGHTSSVVAMKSKVISMRSRLDFVLAELKESKNSWLSEFDKAQNDLKASNEQFFNKLTLREKKLADEISQIRSETIEASFVKKELNLYKLKLTKNAFIEWVSYLVKWLNCFVVSIPGFLSNAINSLSGLFEKREFYFAFALLAISVQTLHFQSVEFEHSKFGSDTAKVITGWAMAIGFELIGLLLTINARQKTQSWLFIFAVLAFGINLAYYDVAESWLVSSWHVIAEKVMLAFALPASIYAMAHLYLRRK